MSAMTIASSTTIPRTTISAAMETWCSCDPEGVHHAERSAQGHRNGEGRDEGDPEGQQEERDQDDGSDGDQELVAQCAIRSLTTSGWLAMKSICRSGGSRSLSRVKTFSSFSPISTIFFPFCISTESRRQGLPS